MFIIEISDVVYDSICFLFFHLFCFRTFDIFWFLMEKSTPKTNKTKQNLKFSTTVHLNYSAIAIGDEKL